MWVYFKYDGYIVLERNTECIPEIEDRVKIFDDFYIVDDRMFFFRRNEEFDRVDVYLSKISE